MMRWMLLGLCGGLLGCAGLPPRSGCMAGDARYTWMTRTPQGIVAMANCWGPGASCPAFQASVEVNTDGKVTKASCTPARSP